MLKKMPPAREMGYEYTEKNVVEITNLYIIVAACLTWGTWGRRWLYPSCIFLLQPAWELGYTGKKVVVPILYIIVAACLGAGVHGEKGGCNYRVLYCCSLPGS